MKGKRPAAQFAAVILGFVIAAPTASALDAEHELSNGIALYNAKNYRAAAEHLHNALLQKPGCLLARCYYAYALGFLDLPDQANKELGTCHLIGSVNKNAQNATNLNELDSWEKPAIVVLHKQESEVSAESEEKAKGQNAVAAAKPVADYFSKTLAQMHTQVGIVQSNMQREMEDLAREEMRSGEQKATEVEREAEEVLGIMRTAFRLSRRTGEMVPVYGPGEVQEAVERYKKRIEKIRNTAKANADHERDRARAYNAQMEAEVASLKEQLDASATDPKHVHLQPVGTNLYVRMYAHPRFSPHPAEPETEMLATQEKMVLDSITTPGKRSYRVVPAEFVADQGALVVEGKPDP
ncbi:MAG TPA: hypothetical protein V6C72_10295, partial [Chroococcales cyanobacterium]